MIVHCNLKLRAAQDINLFSDIFIFFIKSICSRFFNIKKVFECIGFRRQQQKKFLIYNMIGKL